MDILRGVNYFYTTNGQQVGPIEGTQLVGLAQQGQLSITDQVWTEGMAEWQPAASFTQLAFGIQSATEAGSPRGDYGST